MTVDTHLVTHRRDWREVADSVAFADIATGEPVGAADLAEYGYSRNMLKRAFRIREFERELTSRLVLPSDFAAPFGIAEILERVWRLDEGAGQDLLARYRTGTLTVRDARDFQKHFQARSGRLSRHSQAAYNRATLRERVATALPAIIAKWGLADLTPVRQQASPLRFDFVATIQAQALAAFCLCAVPSEEHSGSEDLAVRHALYQHYVDLLVVIIDDSDVSGLPRLRALWTALGATDIAIISAGENLEVIKAPPRSYPEVRNRLSLTIEKRGAFLTFKF